MNAAELMSRTSRYRLSQPLLESESENETYPPSQHSDERPRSRRRDSSPRVIPPAISDAPYPTTSTSIPATYPDRNVHRQRHEPHDEPHDSQESIAPTNTNVDDAVENQFNRSIPQAFKVTAHCNEPSDDEEEESSPDTLQDRYDRAHAFPYMSFSSFEDEVDPASAARMRMHSTQSAAHSQLCRGRVARYQWPSNIDTSYLGDAERNDRALTPLAKFFIEKNKNVISIAFEPPV